MSGETGFRWFDAWVGGLTTGVTILVFLLVMFAYRGPLIVAALLLAALIAGFAFVAYRRGKPELAMGMVGGYGLIALVSGGECTLFVSLPHEIDGREAERAFFGYPLVLALTLIGLIGLTIYRRRSGGGSP